MIEQLLIPEKSLILGESEIPNVDHPEEEDTLESLILDESLIPNVDHLITEDDTPVDNEEQNFIPNFLLFLLEYLWADRIDWC